MKTINKSAVMKRAWKIFRGNSEYSWSFSESLKRAWWVKKSNAGYFKEEEKEETVIITIPVETKNPHSSSLPISQEAYNSFYSGCKYFTEEDMNNAVENGLSESDKNYYQEIQMYYVEIYGNQKCRKLNKYNFSLLGYISVIDAHTAPVLIRVPG